MTYFVKRSDPTLPIINVNENSINTVNTSLILVGENYKNYGEFINQNLVRQLENFAHNQPPKNPIKGQLWYDTSAKTMYFYDPAVSTLQPWRDLSSGGGGGGGPTLGNIFSDSANGTIAYAEGSAVAYLTPSSPGQFLSIDASGFPVWSDPPEIAKRLEDGDGDTYITVEDTSGGDEDRIRAFAGGIQRIRIDNGSNTWFYNTLGDQSIAIASSNTYFYQKSLLQFNSSGEMLTLQDTKGILTSATPFIAFRDNVSTRLSYIGHGSTANNDIYIRADAGNIRLSTDGGYITADSNIGVGGKINPDSFIHFPNNTVNDNINRILLWGNSQSDLNSGYGFGIASGTLTYNTPGQHSLRHRGTEKLEVNSTGIIVRGETTSTGTITIQNTAPYLHFNDTNGIGWSLEGNGNNFYLRRMDNNDVQLIVNSAGDVIADGSFTGSGFVSTAGNGFRRNASNSFLRISGSNNHNQGGNIVLYGHTHGSNARRIDFRHDNEFYAVFDPDRLQFRINNNNRLVVENGKVYSAVPLVLDGSDRGIRSVTGQYGTIQTTGPGLNGWEGYSINGHAVFMGNSSSEAFGLYDDANNRWALQYNRNGGYTGLQAPSGDWGLLSRNNAETELYHNGNLRLETTSYGTFISGRLENSTTSPEGLRLRRNNVNGNSAHQYITIYDSNSRQGYMGYYNGIMRFHADEAADASQISAGSYYFRVRGNSPNIETNCNFPGAAQVFRSNRISAPLTQGNLVRNHGLGGLPQIGRVVFECINPNNGFSVGDEVEIVTSNSDSWKSIQMSSLILTPTQIRFVYYEHLGIYPSNFPTSSYMTITGNPDFRLRLYAIRFA